MLKKFSIIGLMLTCLSVNGTTFAENLSFGGLEAFKAMRNGNGAQALELINADIKAEPQNKFLYNTQALIYEDLQMYDAAFESYAYALSIDSTYATPYYNRANLYRNLGFYPKAIEDYTRAIENNYPGTAPYINRGLVYLYNLNNPDAALKDFLMGYDEESEGAYYGASVCYGIKGMYPEAIKAATKAIELREDNPDAYFVRGKSKVLTLQIDSGIQDLYIAMSQYRNAGDYKAALEVQRLYNKAKTMERY